MKTTFDVIVVGAGHAGIEAAHIAAKMGIQTLIITLDKNKIGIMPCNPSIGGLGKGHIVFEVSALGGLMPSLCSKSFLQSRMLNTRKGPAVQGLRLQIDKYKYAHEAKKSLEQIKNLTIHQDMVIDVIANDGKVKGVRCREAGKIFCKTLIITSGTYLNGLVHIGHENRPGGKDDSESVTSLTKPLENLLETKFGRLKTGTPPRLLKSSIDFSKLEQQSNHELSYLFEFNPVQKREVTPCFIAYTNKRTHEIIKNNLNRSALFGGNITGIGPRYCPSIEDKIARFPERTSHHVFIEPEGGSFKEVYPGGLSTSLPLEIQKSYINSINGLENAVITRPGYAIEYDFLQPRNIKHTLETKKISGLFFAGQINGTTGYEEAAGQGIIAGINATLKIKNEKPLILNRHESYIGVMIDDLVTIGVDEPYRMFTSRAERRLLLRQDNAYQRLTPYAKKLETIPDDQYQKFLEEKKFIKVTLEKINQQRPHGKLFKIFHDINFSPEHADSTLITSQEPGANARSLITVHAEIRYEGYIAKEQKEIVKAKKFQTLIIPSTFNYNDLPGLTRELQQKLELCKPKTIGQAQLIPGMTPAAISLLIFRVQRGNVTLG
jgi:tRNA uridine 5-carboxymethylaminomethyl modification enzyme